MFILAEKLHMNAFLYKEIFLKQGFCQVTIIKKEKLFFYLEVSSLILVFTKPEGYKFVIFFGFMP